MRFVNRWRMPLIFVVSGAAIALALGSRSPRTFALDRCGGCGAAGVRHGRDRAAADLSRAALSRQFTGSFLEWLPHAFEGGAYPNGNVSWHHLWFLAYVLVLTFVLLPYFLRARASPARRPSRGPGK